MEQPLKHAFQKVPCDQRPSCASAAAPLTSLMAEVKLYAANNAAGDLGPLAVGD